MLGARPSVGDKTFQYYKLVTQTRCGTNENPYATAFELHAPANEKMYYQPDAYQPISADQPVTAYQPVTADQPVPASHTADQPDTADQPPANLVYGGYGANTQKLQCAATIMVFVFLVLTCGLGLPLTIPTFFCLYKGSNARNIKRRKIFIILAFTNIIALLIFPLIASYVTALSFLYING